MGNKDGKEGNGGKEGKGGGRWVYVWAAYVVTAKYAVDELTYAHGCEVEEECVD